jgi:hypothetical protein
MYGHRRSAGGAGRGDGVSGPVLAVAEGRGGASARRGNPPGALRLLPPPPAATSSGAFVDQWADCPWPGPTPLRLLVEPRSYRGGAPRHRSAARRCPARGDRSRIVYSMSWHRPAATNLHPQQQR